MHPLSRKSTAMMVIDVQERLFPHIDQGKEMLQKIKQAVDGFKLLKLPILVTEQVPEKMGKTVFEVEEPLDKSAFSCLGDSAIHKKVVAIEQTQWVLVGIETHVCVLQTARDLLAEGREVVVLCDAVGSRFPINKMAALDELREMGVRISTVETILFELLGDAKAAEFRQLRDLIK